MPPIRRNSVRNGVSGRQGSLDERQIPSSFSNEFVSKSNSTIVHRRANCDLDLKFEIELADSVENL